jgi:hypothetical protein
MEDFNYKKFLTENKLTTNSRKLNELRDIPKDLKDDKEFYDKLRGVIQFGMDKWKADAGDVWQAISAHSKFYGGQSLEESDAKNLARADDAKIEILLKLIPGDIKKSIEDLVDKLVTQHKDTPELQGVSTRDIAATFGTIIYDHLE